MPDWMRMARKPCSRWSRTESNSSGRSAPLACPYVSAPVRLRPPSSWYSGMPAARALMSHSAVSTAAIDAIVTGPRRQYAPRYRNCHMSSMRCASLPDEQRHDVLGQIGDDRELATVERGVAEPDEPVVGGEAQGDEVAAGARDEHLGGRDEHGSEPFEIGDAGGERVEQGRGEVRGERRQDGGGPGRRVEGRASASGPDASSVGPNRTR